VNFVGSPLHKLFVAFSFFLSITLIILSYTPRTTTTLPSSLFSKPSAGFLRFRPKSQLMVRSFLPSFNHRIIHILLKLNDAVELNTPFCVSDEHVAAILDLYSQHARSRNVPPGTFSLPLSLYIHFLSNHVFSSVLLRYASRTFPVKKSKGITSPRLNSSTLSLCLLI